jgi:hypothetical protein
MGPSISAAGGKTSGLGSFAGWKGLIRLDGDAKIPSGEQFSTLNRMPGAVVEGFRPKSHRAIG